MGSSPRCRAHSDWLHDAPEAAPSQSHHRCSTERRGKREGSDSFTHSHPITHPPFTTSPSPLTSMSYFSSHIISLSITHSPSHQTPHSTTTGMGYVPNKAILLPHHMASAVTRGNCIPWQQVWLQTHVALHRTPMEGGRQRRRGGEREGEGEHRKESKRKRAGGG